MNVRLVKIDELSTSQVEYYSVHLAYRELSEFELFDEKEFPEHLKVIKKIYAIIQEIGRRGAKA